MHPVELVKNLRTFLPLESVLHQTEDVKPYECDGLSAYRQVPMIVAIPEDEAQVRRILELCYNKRVPVVARSSVSPMIRSGRTVVPNSRDATLATTTARSTRARSAGRLETEFKAGSLAGPSTLAAGVGQTCA